MDWFMSQILKVLKESGKDIQDPRELTKIFEKSIEMFGEKTVKNIKSEMSEGLEDRREYQSGFEKRLYERWKKPLDLLEVLIYISTELGEEFNQKHRKEAVKNEDYIFEVLTRMHGRACHTAFEIFTLLKSGFAEGGNALWRTLYEITIFSYFIEKHGQEVAERFSLYDSIENYELAKAYNKYHKLLGYEALKKEEFEELEKARNELSNKFGKDFCKLYGWLRNILNKPTISEIAENVGLDKLLPFYKWSCSNVHAGTKGLRDNLGLIKDNPKSNVILVGPSNYGLADPGQNTAISLYQMNTCLLATRPSTERLIEIKVVEKLVDEIEDSFCKVQLQIEEEEKEESKS